MIDIENEDLCIVAMKFKNSNKFYSIYQDKIYSYARAIKIVKKLQLRNLDYKIYKITEIEQL